MTGEKVFHLREQFDLTQEELASLLHVSYSTVNRWEAKGVRQGSLQGILLHVMWIGVSLDPSLPKKIRHAGSVEALAMIFKAAAIGKPSRRAPKRVTR